MRRGRLSTTYRRRRLDQDLARACAGLRGLVLDLGGERRGRRGTFRPPPNDGLRWLCVNRDIEVRPEIVADAGAVPLADASADAVLLCEVLEHVARPERVVAEAHRLLKPGGRLILSMPFLFRIHEDPGDYQRFTRSKLAALLVDAGFTDLSIREQGRYFLLLSEMARGALARLRPAPLRWSLALLLLPWMWLMVRVDGRPWVARSPYLSSYVTGYFVEARKPGGAGA